MSTRRARSARRRAAPVGAWAAATNPSQRQTSPSGDTSRCPVFSCDTSSAPRSRATTPICASRRASSAGASTWAASGSTPSGKAGSPSVTPALVQRIGADGSTGASRSSPSAAPIAFSYPLATVMPSMIGGHRFLVSPLTSLEMVRASVSSRCTRLSASPSGARAASSLDGRRRGRLRWLGRCLGLRQALLRGFHRGGERREITQALVSCASFCSSPSTLAISWSSRASRSRWLRTLPSSCLRRAVRSASAVVSSANRRSVAASVASASATRSSTPLRFSTRDLISSFSSASSVSSRCSATSASEPAAARGRYRPKIASAGGRARRRAPWRALPRGRGFRAHW